MPLPQDPAKAHPRGLKGRDHFRFGISGNLNEVGHSRAILNQKHLGPFDRIARLRFRDFGVRAIRRQIDHRMPDMAIGFDMQQLRPAAAPYLFHQIAGQNIQPKRVIPIERLRRKAETLGARDGTVAPGQLIGARGRRVFIVLANKKDRQVENAGPIQTFQKAPG